MTKCFSHVDVQIFIKPFGSEFAAVINDIVILA